ncbi:MAG: hypothetical protein ACAH95_18160, partial [Fimbriimonas sp.]
NGSYSFTGIPDGSGFVITEVVPTGNWVQSYPVGGSYTGNLNGSGTPDNLGYAATVLSGGNDFANFQFGGRGGHTLGFWSNKNGLATMNTNNPLACLVALNLRNANGSHFDPANLGAFQKWLTSANATNMANMLSAQMAAMKMNVRYGITGGSWLIWAPGALGANGFGYITVDNLIAEANASLGANGNTVASGAVRTYQNALKDALDRGNNNLNVYILPAP